MRQGTFYTYPLGQKLEHTSLWMTPRSREWLRHAAKSACMSQALIVDTLIRDYRLRELSKTPSALTKKFQHEREEVDELLSFLTV